MEVKVNIKANKLTDEQQRVLVDALTDYVAEEGDMNIAQNLAARIKQGMVMLFEYEPQLTPLKDFAPKQEWSEEDEETLKIIDRDLQEFYSRRKAQAGSPLFESQMQNIRWLKSLKDRVGCEVNCEVNCTTKWKPSDEQMKALDIAIRCGIQLGTWEEKALKELREQLKELPK